MIKNIFQKLLLFALFAVMCCVSVTSATAESASKYEWSDDNSLIVYIKEEYVDEVSQNPEAAFAETNPASVYIVSLNDNPPSKSLKLLFVLPENNPEAKQAAVKSLNDDSRVSSVNSSSGAPFDTVNTLKLTAEKNTIHVGETVCLKPEGELKTFNQCLDLRTICAVPADSNKTYTPEDFPRLPIKGIHQMSAEPGYPMMLTLNENTDYFTLIHTADALARISDISAVWLQYIELEALPYSEFCTVSDNSVAKFVNTKEENYYLNGAQVGDVNENGEYVLKAAAPGKVTVTYYIYEAYGGPYTAETEITVLAKENSSSSDTDSKDISAGESSVPDVQTGVSATDRHQTNNPKTGDSFPAAVTILACASVTMVLCSKKTKK